jgi:hypothetical protein
VAIYRPQRSRRRVAILTALVGLTVGLVAGLAIGSRNEPDPVETMKELRASLTQAATVLEIAEVEYGEAVSGTDVTNDSEYQGARDALRRSRSLFGSAAPALEIVDERGVAEMENGYERLQTLMSAPAESQEVSRAIGELSALLREPLD